MTDTTRNVPAIRFTPFTTPWQQKDLGQVVDVRSGRDYKHLSNGSIPVYGTGGYMLSVSDALSHKEDAIGIGRKGTIDKPYVLKAPFWTVDTLFYAVPYKENDLSFVYGLFQRTDWKSKDESTGVPSLSKVAINNVSVTTPEEEEQIKIGDYFQQLDTLITQHQQKHDKLLNLKKSLLEKMFPKQGDVVPAIRFKGFNETWNDKRLGDIAEIKTGPFGSALHADDYVEDGEPIITTEHFKSGLLPKNKNGIPQVSDIDYRRLRSYRLCTGDIVFSRVGSVDINAHVTLQSGWLFSGRVLRVRITDLVDAEYLHHELSTVRVRKNVISRAVGQTMPSINTQILAVTPLKISNDIEEQGAIGDLFQKVDKLLELHQQQLTKLKNLKQAHLAKMFV